MAAIGTSVALRTRGVVFFISVEVSDGVFGILTAHVGNGQRHFAASKAGSMEFGVS